MTNKIKFQKLLEKIYLDGIHEMTLININDNFMSINGFLQQRMLISEVFAKGNIFDFSDDKIAVTDMETLLKMIKVFPDETELSVVKGGSGNIFHYIMLKSDLIESKFILGKERAINTGKKVSIKKIEEKIQNDIFFKFRFSDFLEEYKKYNNVLKSYDTFYFSVEGDNVSLNFGGINKKSENTIKIDLGVQPQRKFKDTILFSKDIFNGILSANQDSEIFITVSDRLYIIECEEEEFKSRYVNSKRKNQ